MKFSADYRALALDALRGRWKTAVLAGIGHRIKTGSRKVFLCLQYTDASPENN